MTHPWQQGEGPLNPVGAGGGRTKVKLTHQQRSECFERYRAGEDVRALALEYGITAGYIRAMAGRRDT